MNKYLILFDNERVDEFTSEVDLTRRHKRVIIKGWCELRGISPTGINMELDNSDRGCDCFE